MIAKYGADCIWSQSTILTPDVNKPWEKAKGVITPYNVKIVFFSMFGGQTSYRYVKNSETIEGEFTGLMAKQTFIPNIKDIVTVKGETLVIVDIDVCQPSFDDIYYDIIFKRGA